MKKGVGIAAFVFLAAAAAAAQTAGPEWTKFEIARERLGHKVIIDAALANPLAAEITDLRILAIFYSGATELRRTTATQVARIAPGQTVPVRLEGEQVPNFDRYEVIVECAGKKLVYVPQEPGKPPALKKASLPRLTVTAYKDAPPSPFPGPATLQVTVRNLGESEAQEPTALVGFQDAAGAVVHRVHVRLGPSIKAQEEVSFDLSVPKVPEYATATVGIGWMAAEIPAPVEPPADAAEVTLRKLRIVRLTDGAAHLTGTVHNGTAAAIDKVRINFRLGKKVHPWMLPGGLAGTASRTFDFYVTECPPFDEGAFSLGYEEARGAPAAVPPEPQPSARRTGAKDTSAETVLTPEKDARDLKPKDARPETKEPALTVQILGTAVFETTTVKGTPAGNVVFLRMVFRNAEGNPVQPLGTLTALTYNGDKPFKRVPRNITRESWKMDAGKMNTWNASHEVVAYDSKRGELWVGILRTEGAWFEPRADVSLTIPGAGTWTWKGLSEKFEAPARGPDPKEPKK
jgi:hypothetical protein